MADVSDTTRRPTNHISLTKDGTTVAFNLCNSQGIQDPHAIRQDLQPRMSIKMHQGGTKHSDYEPPYATLEQRDWAGGRGLDDLDQDESRFSDSRAAHTWNEGKIIMGPQATYGEEYRNSDTNIWDGLNYTWLSMYGTYKGWAMKFTPTANYTTGQVSIILKRNGSPTPATVAIFADNAGDPGAVIVTTTVTSTEDEPEEVVASLATALTSGTPYHVTVANASTAWTAENNYELLGDVLTGAHALQTSGSAWVNFDQGPYIRVTDTETPFSAHFIDYAEIPHVVLDYEDDSLAPKIFMNGEFGRITNASPADGTYLDDANKSWTTDEWVGAMVIIYSGSGSGDATRYRTITSNTSTRLNYDTAFDRRLDTSSTYAIINTEIWKEVTGHGMKSYHTVTDAISTGTLAYIARGDRNGLVQMRFPSLPSGAFTNIAGYGGTFLETATDSNGDLKLWAATRHVQDGAAGHVLKSKIPWGDRRGSYGEIDWGFGVEITNSDMELDASWSDVGTVATNERSDVQSYGGTYSRHIVVAGDNAGMYQEITGLIVGDVYNLHGWAQIKTGSANGCKMKFGGTELDALGTDLLDGWVHLTGNFTATLTAHNLEFLSDGGAAEFYIDTTYIAKQKNSLQDAGYEKITGLIAYGEPERLFVATTGGLYMESNGRYLSIPIRDMKAALDERNGRALVVHDVYLFTSFLDGLERYYKSNLDDMGPNREEGLPAGRRGNFSKLTVYPGRIYGAYDGGATDTSSVLMYNAFGWHEVYRAPVAGRRISSLFIQPIPGNSVDRLWIACGSDLLWLPVDLNPQNNSDYNYTYSSIVELQSISYGKKEIEKHWSALKLVTDELTNTFKRRVYADYKVDGESSWTNIGEYNTSPYESKDIVDSSGDKITGRKIKPRLRLETGVQATTPEIEAVALDFIEQVPVKESWSLTFLAEDNNVTLQGVPAFDRVETGLDQLQTWLDDPSPAVIAAWSSMIDGKNVKILSLSYKPILTSAKAQKEKLICTMTVIET